MRELLFSITKKDFIIEWFSGKGAGGQHRNKHQNCCRLRHPESGAVTTAQETKSRTGNLRLAFQRIMKEPKFELWYQKEIWKALNHVSLEDLVKEQMKPENLKIEGKDEDGKWKEFHNIMGMDE